MSLNGQREWPSLWFRALLLALALLASGARVAPAQEMQVGFDSAGRLQDIDPRTAARLGLFIAEYPGFAEARLFQSGGSTTLEILSRREGILIRTRVPLTAEQLADLRARVSAALLSPRAAATQNARSLLLGASTAMGLFLYGPALPTALAVRDARTTTGLYMLTASASFFLPWALTGDAVTPAMAQAAFYGGTRGFLHGGLLHYVAVGHREEEMVCEFDLCYTNEDDIERGAFGAGFVTGIAEGVGGYLWAERTNMTAGEANATSLGGDWGLLNGLGAAHVAGLTEEDDERLGATIALAGAAGGLLAGRRVAATRDWSYGDVEVLSTTGWLGAFSAAAVADQLGVEDSRASVAVAMAGAATGLVLADRLVENSDYSYGQSTMLRLGTLAGGLLGLGTGVLIEPDDGDLAWIFSAAGAVGGYLGTHRVIGPDARLGAEARALRLEIAPQGIAEILAPGALTGPGRGVPLASVHYRF